MRHSYCKHQHKVAIALGSNLGDRYANIEAALHWLGDRHDIFTLTSTSFLYESDPMYVTEQDKFLNCAITAETNLEPTELLTLLKEGEEAIGRVKSIRNGPRAIDLDIIFYDSIVLDNREDEGDGSQPGQLVIPHARLGEREFVLRPLNDIIPNHVHPILHKPIHELLDSLIHEFGPSLLKILPFPSPPHHQHIKPVLWPLSLKTYVMAVINATPDSFSSSRASTEEAAIAEGMAAVQAGADILDIGGYSTRPGASKVSLKDELGRVVPVVRALREKGVNLPISIDTFRPSVLRAAVEAGANCLNDVTAMSGEGEEEEIMSLLAEDLGIPVIMMHSRGAHRAALDTDYSFPGDVLEGVRSELGLKISNALQAGVRRWNIIVDPGFGFSKTVDGNFELLRQFRQLTAPKLGNSKNLLEGYPTLAGLSRKGFLRYALDKPTEPQEREWATGAAVAASIQQGADIVRVHRVAEMKDIARTADRIWRRLPLKHII